jgi:hypothetical protein
LFSLKIVAIFDEALLIRDFERDNLALACGLSRRSKFFLLLADVAFKRRCFGESVRLCERALQIDDQDHEVIRRHCRFRRYEQITARFKPAPFMTVALHKSADYAVHVINTDRSARRLDRVMRSFYDSAVSVQRVPGVLGGQLPDSAARDLWRGIKDAESRKGALGCLLSHVSSWETVIRHNIKFCLVVEDDVGPILNLPAKFAEYGIPQILIFAL